MNSTRSSWIISELSIFIPKILNRRLSFAQSFRHKRCVLCLAPGTQDICPACLGNLPRVPLTQCPSCLLPTPSAQLCGTCLRKPPAWTTVRSALRYTFPVDVMVQTLKYRSDLTLAPVLADLLLTELCPDTLPDYVIPVPLHPARLRERGFNQALEISRYLCKKTGRTLLPHACSRTRDTPSQTELPWKHRHRNIRRAFNCTIDLSGKDVAIVDDVMTSGATLNELARAIRRRGAASIHAWVVARAFPGVPPAHGTIYRPENNEVGPPTRQAV